MSASPNRRQALATLKKLKAAYPDARCALGHKNPYELTVATILSAQCTDARVNMVTPALFERFPTPQAMAQATQEELEGFIRSTGFYRNKAKNILGMARRVVDHYGGQIPNTMDNLLTLPGVARKTANVVLETGFGLVEGVVVDTHVGRLARRLGWTAHTDPVKVERDLCALFPQKEWGDLAHVLIHHGRGPCEARNPRCHDCPVAARCPSAL